MTLLLTLGDCHALLLGVADMYGSTLVPSSNGPPRLWATCYCSRMAANTNSKRRLTAADRPAAYLELPCVFIALALGWIIGAGNPAMRSCADDAFSADDRVGVTLVTNDCVQRACLGTHFV